MRAEMLGPLSRFVGRLPVGRKLLLIYLLDLTAVIFVSGILINEKYIAINFARKELAGNAYMALVRDTLLALPVPVGQGAQPVEAAAVSRWTDNILAAEQRHGRGMRAADPSRTTVAALHALAADPKLDPARYTEVLDASRALITRVGNQSNMILDPDLDSYYTMSLVLLRFPELVELLARTAQKAIQIDRAPDDLRARHQTELLILEGQLDAVLRGIESDYGEAIAAGLPSLAAKLAPSQLRLRTSVTVFRVHSARLGARVAVTTADTDRLALATEQLAITTEHAASVASLALAWNAASASLDELLQARIDRLIARMWLHLGTAAGLLLVILGLVYFVARQIALPIRRLASVADQVSRSGDYTVRAAYERDPRGADEIGQLFGAFNGMLGELDRDRAMREELAATSRAEEAQRQLLASFPTPLIVTSIPEHRVLHANVPALPWLAGLTTDPWMACLDPADRARYFQRLSDLGSVDGFEVRWKTPAPPLDGQPAHTTQWALLSGRQLVFQGQPALLTAFTPINQQKSLELRLQLWAKVFEASSESIVIFDAGRALLTANRAFTRTTGWDPIDVLGQTPEFLYSARHDLAFYETIWQAAIIRGFWQGEVWLKRRSGEPYPTWLVANAVRGPDGRISHLVAAAVDITDHKLSEARIHHLAHHDVLTDLPNRSLCMERLRMAVAQAERSGALVGVVFIDLDRFKNINDSMGHHVGDALLISVSQRLLQAVRAGDTVSRLGGDEFVVVINGTASIEEIGAIVTERMVPLVQQTHQVEGLALNVSCSAGIAVFPRDGRDIDHLMRHADAAMYQAKAAGRNQALFFSPEFHAQAQERHWIENALRDAAERGELRLHYQPRIDTLTHQVIGVEALLRWQHPEQGAIEPSRFIQIAEETGLIIPIGTWVLDEACRQQAEWLRKGVGRIAVSVNVSAIQLRDPTLPQLLSATLVRHGVDPAAIELELTETALMDNAIATVESLQKLKRLGVMLAIDDFGTGYSSLNYLHQFPIDKLKIDQSFVRDMLDDQADLAITQAIIGLGHTLGLRVVAEGVERIEEERLLRAAGCDELQGHLFAPAMSVTGLADWLADKVIADPVRLGCTPLATGVESLTPAPISDLAI